MPEKDKKGEIWKDIPEYEGCYQASNLGRVRSLDRTITYSNGYDRFYKGVVLNGNINRDGYRQTTLCVSGAGRNFMFSQLVAMAFLGHKPNGNTLVVDHINGDKLDDRVENLRIVTNRANTTTCFRSDRDSLSSTYVGVARNSQNSKWMAQIHLNGEDILLGFFNVELEAAVAYQTALSKIKDGSFNPDDYKPKWTSKYKWVYFDKAINRWVAKITVDKKRFYVGSFHTEVEAYHASLEAVLCKSQSFNK